MTNPNDSEIFQTYISVREDILRKISSNSQAYDKVIISLSSAGLFISTSFLTKVININGAISLKTLIFRGYCLH